MLHIYWYHSVCLFIFYWFYLKFIFLKSVYLRNFQLESRLRASTSVRKVLAIQQEAFSLVPKHTHQAWWYTLEIPAFGGRDKLQ